MSREITVSVGCHHGGPSGVSRVAAKSARKTTARMSSGLVVAATQRSYLAPWSGATLAALSGRSLFAQSVPLI